MVATVGFVANEWHWLCLAILKPLGLVRNLRLSKWNRVIVFLIAIDMLMRSCVKFFHIRLQIERWLWPRLVRAQIVLSSCLIGNDITGLMLFREKNVGLSVDELAWFVWCRFHELLGTARCIVVNYFSEFLVDWLELLFILSKITLVFTLPMRLEVFRPIFILLSHRV